MPEQNKKLPKFQYQNLISIFQNINNYKQENNAEKSTRINEVAIVEYKESFFKKCINKIFIVV